MEVQKVLIMNPGDNETSYANNSASQKQAIMKSRYVMEYIVRKTWKGDELPSCFRMADLACSSGPNALSGPSYIIDIIEKICGDQNSCSRPEFEVYLNDLPNNDFNTLFKLLNNFHEEGNQKGRRCFISGLPGSFYDRLFPSQSLHFVSCFTALQWLSKVPDEILEKNKGNIHLGQSSPDVVFEAYLNQFKSDFSTFLKFRAEEIKHGGLMVLTLPIRKPFMKDGLEVFSVLAEALLEMCTEGVIEEAKIDGFSLPLYAASKEELEETIQREGSFKIDKIEVFELNLDTIANTNIESARIIQNQVRAVTEPMVASHFGASLMDELYAKLEKHLAMRFSHGKLSSSQMVVALTRK